MRKRKGEKKKERERERVKKQKRATRRKSAWTCVVRLHGRIQEKR